jgi:hypothetical protein
MFMLSKFCCLVMYSTVLFRHIILIRHGQYNLNGNGDKEKYLTELGREQVTGAILDIIGHLFKEISSNSHNMHL